MELNFLKEAGGYQGETWEVLFDNKRAKKAIIARNGCRGDLFKRFYPFCKLLRSFITMHISRSPSPDISQHIYGFPKVNHALSDLWMGKKDLCRSKSCACAIAIELQQGQGLFFVLIEKNIIISIIETIARIFLFESITWILMQILYVQDHSEHYAIWNHTAGSCFRVGTHF